MISIVIILLFISPVNNIYSQEAQKNRIFSFNSFEGGIATKLSDQSTNQKYARIAENVRLNSSLKAITKRDQVYLYGTADASEAITGIHRLYLTDLTKKLIVTHGDEIEVGNDSTGAFTTILNLTTADYRWQWITWHNLAIGTDGYNYPVKTNGTQATYLGTCYCKDNGAGAGPNGTYTYKIAFYSATKVYITNVASNSVTVTDNDIDLTMIPIGPDTILGESIVGRKVYRSENTGAGTYKLLTNGTIADNTTTTLTDSDADAALGANYPAGDETWTPPKGKFCLIHKNRLWIANNPTYPSRIYYSTDGAHDVFDPLAYFDIRSNDGDEITFIKNLLGVLTVAKTNTIQKIYTTGADPDADWEISDPFSFIGCDAPYSAINTPIGIIYLSRAKSGLYVFNGQASTLKSEQITPNIQDILSSNLISVWGEYNNNLYYMAYPSSSVGGSTNNRVLVYDLLSDAYTIDTLSINCFTSFNGTTDGGGLYSGSSINGKVYSFGITDQSVIDSKHSDFTGTFDDARFIPVDVGGNINSPIIELSWDLTVDNLVGTINALTGDVDRPDGTGSYISPVINTIGATSYDKIFWNETLPAGCNATFAIRSGSTPANCVAAAFSSEFSSPAGSDLSALSANEYTQYRITLSSSDIDYTPNITTSGGYTVRLTYKTLGTASETAIALHWQTGYLDFGAPGYKKNLRKLIVYHEGTNGTLTITFTNEHGDTDTFNIDLATNPTIYEEYFTTGAFTGTKIKMDVINSDLNALKIKEIILVGDIEPLV